jgi:hypothetical protein
MKKVMKVVVLVLYALFTAAVPAVAAGVKTEVVMRQGSMVRLFHSGTADVKKEICLNDVIPVYRLVPVGYGGTKGWDQARAQRQVGKIRIISYLGENYLEGEVVAGQIKPGDIAKKETAGCLVMPEE